MSRSLPFLCSVVALGVVLAGCSGSYAERASQRQAAYAAAAGASVRSFHFFSPLYSWESLSNQQLVVYTQPNQAWLLDVDMCPNLPFANAVGVTSNAHEVSVRFDRILVAGGGPGGSLPCIIMQIRPVDLSQLKAARQAQRKIDEQPRPPAAPDH